MRSLIQTRGFAAIAAVAFLTACAPVAEEQADTLPAMRWDHRPEAETWTLSTMNAIEERGPSLIGTVPKDIETYCPGYEEADTDERAAFWAGLFSAIAKYESTWNPKAIGGGGLYHGLLQILPATARSAGCNASALLDGTENLSCAVKIANRRVHKSNGTVHSITADWGPMHWQDKRTEMASWTSQQEYCRPDAKGPLASLINK